MNDERKPNAFKFCVSCPIPTVVNIQFSGWWNPRCDHWNYEKSTKQKPYGPMAGCHYSLEHTVLDNRRGFKLCNGESFKPLIDFAVSEYEKPKEERVSFKITGKGKYTNLIVSSKSRDGDCNSVKEIVDWVNRCLLSQKCDGFRHIEQDEVDRFVKGQNEQWVLEPKKEDEEKKP